MIRYSSEKKNPRPYDRDDTEGGNTLSPVREKKTALVEPPPLYRVLLLNDDYTPMEFVVLVLVKFFHLSEESAVAVMLRVHHEGLAVCGIYPKDIAQTKVECVRRFAKEHEHPLACEWEVNP